MSISVWDMSIPDWDMSKWNQGEMDMSPLVFCRKDETII